MKNTFVRFTAALAATAMCIAATPSRTQNTMRITAVTQAVFTVAVPAGEIAVLPAEQCRHFGGPFGNNLPYRWCISTAGQVAITPIVVASKTWATQQDCEWNGCSCNGAPCKCRDCKMVGNNAS